MAVEAMLHFKGEMGEYKVSPYFYLLSQRKNIDDSGKFSKVHIASLKLSLEYTIHFRSLISELCAR